jgi:hypothetical protein
MLVSELISKPIYQVLVDLTQEPRIEVALPIAIRDWVRLKLDKTIEQRLGFEAKYGTDFQTFQQAWHAGNISESHSYEVEQDYWEWEASITDEERLQAIIDSLP